MNAGTAQRLLDKVTEAGLITSREGSVHGRGGKFGYRSV
jgi:hypothetical protein